MSAISGDFFFGLMPRLFRWRRAVEAAAFEHGRDLVEVGHIFLRIAVDQDQGGEFSAVKRSPGDAEPGFDCLNSPHPAKMDAEWVSSPS